MRFDRRKGFDAARGAKVEANAPCTASAPLSIQGVELQEKIGHRRWCVDLVILVRNVIEWLGFGACLKSDKME